MIKRIIISLFIGILLIFTSYGFQKKDYPNEYYNVYLDGEFLGSILSSNELYNYIEEKTEHLINIKNITKTYCGEELDKEEVINLINNSEDVKYYEKESKCVDITIKDGDTIENVYTPNGLTIEKNVSYNTNITSVSDIYAKIVEKKSFTMKGYQFTITNKENDKITVVYVKDKDIFSKAITSVIETYLGPDNYSAYLKNTQSEIETTGTYIENVYIDESITVKEKQIPVNEVIYTSSIDLAQFLLYGNDPVTSEYIVKEGQMIEDIAYENEISSQEFLISNPKYKDKNSLIKVGSKVLIKQTNPQIKVVSEVYSVEDKVSEYKTIYEYDDNEYIGYEKVKQTGNDGLERISQRLKIENGYTVYVEPKGKEILKATVDKIVVKGEKVIPNVGDLNNWAWPTDSGWTNTSGYEWRIHPITFVRHFHYGLDIAGTGYNSPVYAANNGTVITRGYHWSFGNYIVINHNNGYYTLYAHMNKFVPGISIGDTVSRGQQIGYVGSTGESTGPHLHLEVWKGCEFCRINPWSIYK